VREGGRRGRELVKRRWRRGNRGDEKRLQGTVSSTVCHLPSRILFLKDSALKPANTTLQRKIK